VSQGLFISTIDINSDSALNGFGSFTCASGTGAQVVGGNGRVGGPGSKRTTVVSYEGNRGLNLRAGQLIDAVQFVSPSDKVSAWQGGAGGQPKSVQCRVGSAVGGETPMTEKVVAIFGQATASNVITIGVRCEKFPWKSV
jgi:hypothetical protein